MEQTRDRPIFKIVSGGQSGVDRAALDFAIDHQIAHGGWCPAGRIAEDGPIHPRYQLTETREKNYTRRTRLNVRDSDGTLIMSYQPLEGGTALTNTYAIELDKPCLAINPSSFEETEKVKCWLDSNAINVLNIAGPRASKQPQIYAQCYQFLEKLFFSHSINSHTIKIG